MAEEETMPPFTPGEARAMGLLFYQAALDRVPLEKFVRIAAETKDS